MNYLRRLEGSLTADSFLAASSGTCGRPRGLSPLSRPHLEIGLREEEVIEHVIVAVVLVLLGLVGCIQSAGR
jgi:hypothetical protein